VEIVEVRKRARVAALQSIGENPFLLVLVLVRAHHRAVVARIGAMVQPAAMRENPFSMRYDAARACVE
jgi:hypothetical protein